MGTAKIRVFKFINAKAANPCLAVDFQRRCGDSLAFNHFCKKAVAHVRPKCEGQSADDSPQHQLRATETPHAEVLLEPLLTPSPLTPLLAMASCTEPALLAEGLTALVSAAHASAANAQVVCSQLANTHPFQRNGVASFVDLLRTPNSIAVAFAAAQLATALCRCGMVCSGPAAADQELLRVALSEMLTPKPCSGVQCDVHP